MGLEERRVRTEVAETEQGVRTRWRTLESVRRPPRAFLFQALLSSQQMSVAFLIEPAPLVTQRLTQPFTQTLDWSRPLTLPAHGEEGTLRPN